MRLNENTKIVGQRVILVPYEAKHVKKYHQWMQSPELQALTASEPLTLDEEYAMQKSWREDEDKCTFLILSSDHYERTHQDEIESLIGDTNLFLRKDEDTNDLIAEAEIMIAEKDARGKHCGWEAMLLMMKYAVEYINVHKFEAKIGMENQKSLAMFKKMQFMEEARSEVFQEITLSVHVSKKWTEWLDKQVQLNCQAYAA